MFAYAICAILGNAWVNSSLCLGIGRVAWLIGWGLMLEYTVGGSTVARGISPNLVSTLPTLSCGIHDFVVEPGETINTSLVN